jgi:hypothetical protein
MTAVVGVTSPLPSSAQGPPCGRLNAVSTRWRVLLSVVSRLIVAAAALVAITLAVFLGRSILQDPIPSGMRMILRASLFAAMFLVMAFMMISYLIRKIPR